MDGHVLIRSTLTVGIVEFLARHWHISEEEAMARFYKTKVAEALCCEESGLYGMSALYIASLCLEECGESLA